MSNSQIPTGAVAATVNAFEDEDVAGRLQAAIEAMEAVVPQRKPHDSKELKRNAGAARFAHELVAPSVSATSAIAEARRIYDGEKGRKALAARDAIRPLIQRGRAYFDSLEFTLNEQLADAGAEALQFYAWAKKYQKRKGGAAIRPYVDEMQRVIQKTLNRRKAAAAPAQNAPPAGPTFLPIRGVAPSASEVEELPPAYERVLADEEASQRS